MRLALLSFVALGLAADVLLFDRNYSRVPPDWVSIGKASPNDKLEVVLHMFQRNRDKLDRVFAEVSNPKSRQYQNFLTKAEVEALVAPLPSDVALVYQWLETVGITKDQVVDYADALGFVAPVSTLAPLFNTEFHTFFNGKTNQRLTAHVGQSYIPAAVSRVVEMVYGLSAFPVGVKGRLGHRGTVNPNLGYKVVAQSWQALYGVPPDWKPQSKLTTQGVIQFDSETYSPEGMQGYSKNILPITGPTKETTVGPETDSPALEAQLDVEAQAACGNGVIQWFWLETPSKWMLSFTTEFLAHDDPLPYSISISYAWSELDQCGQATSPYDCNTFGVNTQGLVERTNTNFQKAGLRGVSVMVASGDSGVHGRTDEACQAKTFRPDFPASSPYVTSVGGTYIEKPKYLPSGGSTPAICQGQCVGGGEEVAVAFSPCQYTSGGGFSNYVVMPDWQREFVKTYLTSGVVLPAASFYNATNRAFPDVSAQGYNIEIYLNPTTPDPVSGTSAASPAFAGIISMLNDASIVKTGHPLGFLNPLLYQMAKETPDAFNDVTKGDNRCTEEGCGIACKGFNAFKGWDPVTGLGTPNYKNMKAALDQILDNKLKMN